MAELDGSAKEHGEAEASSWNLAVSGHSSAERLAELAHRITLSTDLALSLRQIVDAARELLVADIAVVEVLEPDERVHFHGLARYPQHINEIAGGGVDESGMRQPISDPGSRPPNELWNRSISTEDDLGVLVAALQTGNIETALSVRLLGFGETLGGLVVGWRSSVRATNEQLHLAYGLANLGVITLLGARRHADRSGLRDVNSTLAQARTLAHDLNNDLTFLIGYGELLSSRVSGEESEMVVEIIDAARRIIDRSDQMYQLVQARSLPLSGEDQR